MFRSARSFCLGLGVVASLALLLAACGGSHTEPDAAEAASTDPCADSDIDAKRVWNEETRVQVKAQVLQWGGEIGAEMAEKEALEITSSMDRLTDDWARMRKAVCKDHFTRHTLSKEEYQARADCLDRLLSRQRTYLSSLSSPQADSSAQLSAISAELDTCH